MSDEPPTAKVGTWRKFARRGLRWVERLLASIGFLFLVYITCFDLSYMVSPSMAPTLQSGDCGQPDWILTERISG